MSRIGAAARWRQVRLLLQIAFRNVLASRAKSLIVGGIVLFGAALVVVGGSIADSVASNMRRSIQGSLAGHIQVYDAGSKDDLALYGDFMAEPDLEPIQDFSRLKPALEAVPNVKAVVPMGIDQAVITMGNFLDVVLERLREDARGCSAEVPSQAESARTERRCAGEPAREAQYEARKAHVRRMATLLRDELARARASMLDENGRDAAERERNRVDLDRATSDAFWRGFDRDPLGSLEFLENRIAPLAIDGGLLMMRYVGTDLAAFQKAFEGTQIVEGTAVPRGQRGILLGRLYTEDGLKLGIARRLDNIKETRDLFHRRIASDEELQRWVKENRRSTRDILLQLDSIGAQRATERLQRALGTKEPDLQKLIVELLTTDDQNFDERYRIFYTDLVPLLQLYRVKVGDTITIQAASRSGYVKSINVKVYGFVQFKGLEKSNLAGLTSLMDLMSFRDLYGYMTPEQAAEIRKIKESAHVRAVSRENAEAELFGGEVTNGSARAVAIDEARLLDTVSSARKQNQDLLARVYGQEEIDRGVAKNAAVILKDPDRIRETIREIEAAAGREGLRIKAISWQKAAGTVGQFVSLSRLVLYTAVLIIFAVALVIINNAMVMATLQRAKEIGTMRAIGAQRRFVLAMLLVETVSVALVFAAIGAALGAGVVWLIGVAGGIPATTQQMHFFFAGPSLVPRLGTSSLGASLFIVLAVAVLSGLYPALLATRVTPVEAMQSDE